MVKRFTSQNQKVGELGEKVAATYLLTKGFKVIERNYTRKWGEIDLIAMKGSILYFFEVKSLQKALHQPEARFGYRPEENVTQSKLNKIRRTVQTYLLEKGIEEAEWEFGVIGVYLDQVLRKAQVRIYENVML